MKLRSLEEFKTELDNKLSISHPGNIQIEIGDKLLLHYAEAHDNDYDDEGNEHMTAMFMSLKYYGEHHDAVVGRNKTEINAYYTDGYLSSQLWDFLEDELSEHILILWEAIDNWTLYKEKN